MTCVKSSTNDGGGIWMARKVTAIFHFEYLCCYQAVVFLILYDAAERMLGALW